MALGSLDEISLDHAVSLEETEEAKTQIHGWEGHAMTVAGTQAEDRLGPPEAGRGENGRCPEPSAGTSVSDFRPPERGQVTSVLQAVRRVCAVASGHLHVGTGATSRRSTDENVTRFTSPHACSRMHLAKCL